MPEYKKPSEFITYKKFFEGMENKKNFSYEISNDSIMVFYNFTDEVIKNENKKSNLLDTESNHLREIILTLSTIRPFSFTTPYGFRLTQYKKIQEYDEVAQLVIDLSRTPIDFRGEINS
ncbi:hypothetical protein [Enterococcus sp. DIV0240a]|uniref:hypothetical protein n=1 Tax=Enterococcus sp. DIV0240a TaxID=2774651 RepID=UPI003D2BEA99